MAKKDRYRVVSGNYCSAYGAKLAQVDVIAAYPITPQTLIVEHASEFVNNGELKAEYIRVESEHSAMSACIAAEAAGARCFTATSSQGLALMHEMLFIAGSARLPIVMADVNRTVAGPIGIWCEFNDTMPQRDCGWLQCYVEDNQEVLDMELMAYKIGENEKVLLPVMVNLDAFYLSHTVQPVDLMDDEECAKYVGKYKPKHCFIDPKNPIAIASFAPPDYIQETRWQTAKAMDESREVIREVTKDFAKRFGRDYHGLIEEYMMDDAEVALVTLGTVTGTARDVVDEYRAKGKKVGLVKLRFFRPYPIEEMRKALSKVKAIGVYDRSISFGLGGPAYIDTKSTLYGFSTPIVNYLAGLGGRDVTYVDIRKMFDDLLEIAKTGKVKRDIQWIKTRGVEF